MERLIENRGQYIYVKLTGRFNLHELQPRFPVLLKILKEARVSKVLIDCRDMYGNYSSADRYYINHWLADLNVDYMDTDQPQLKIAAVLDKKMIDPEKFGETVAKNRGLQTHDTVDIEEASQWLELAPVNIPA